MAFTVYQTNKKTGVVYAYRSESYRDPVTKKVKSRRTYLGRVDPETKLIIGKGENGRRNRSKLNDPNQKQIMPIEVSDKLEQLRKQIEELKNKNDMLKKENDEYQITLYKIWETIGTIIKK